MKHQNKAQHDARYYNKHKERIKLSKKLKKYRISKEDYQNMLTHQFGVCAICKKTDVSRALSIDHNHQTEVVRGLLCHRCNTGLGLFGDKVEVLLAAATYLSR